MFVEWRLPDSRRPLLPPVRWQPWVQEGSDDVNSVSSAHGDADLDHGDGDGAEITMPPTTTGDDGDHMSAARAQLRFLGRHWSSGA